MAFASFRSHTGWIGSCSRPDIRNDRSRRGPLCTPTTGKINLQVVLFG